MNELEKRIENFVCLGGKHCISNALRQVFNYYKYPLSEEMIFGIASGISFLYLNQAHSPMVSGRTKVFEFEQKLAKRLNITIQCKSSANYEKAEQKAKRMISENHPVLIYVDMPYLNYLNLDQNSHFGGHAVVLFGYDDEKKHYLVSDRDNHDYPIRTPLGNVAEDYHFVSYDELRKARSSSFRPFPAKNKYLVFNFDNVKPLDKTVLIEAITESCNNMLYPGANLLGVNGIKKFSSEILKWEKFDSEKLVNACITNYFMISEDGGTGKGIFRKMYGDFLIEAASILNKPRLTNIGFQFVEVSEKWDKVASMLWYLSETKDVNALKIISTQIDDIYKIESSLYHSLLEILDLH